MDSIQNHNHLTIRQKLYVIIFTNHTKAGRLFDVTLLWLILVSVFAVILESIKPTGSDSINFFYYLELFFTIIFLLEYIARIYVSPKPLKYIFSFLGIIDLVAVLPSLLAIFIPGLQTLLIIRVFRLLRVFRILKLSRYLIEGEFIRKALISSTYKITIFMVYVMSIVLVMGTLMYLIEGEENGFYSIPQGIYWAIVTITTVGYGDITPHTALGKILSSVVMLLGYAIIAVPTGIVTSEMTRIKLKNENTYICKKCSKKITDVTAVFCSHCGEKINRGEV